MSAPTAMTQLSSRSSPFADAESRNTYRGLRARQQSSRTIPPNNQSSSPGDVVMPTTATGQPSLTPGSSGDQQGSGVCQQSRKGVSIADATFSADDILTIPTRIRQSDTAPSDTAGQSESEPLVQRSTLGAAHQKYLVDVEKPTSDSRAIVISRSEWILVILVHILPIAAAIAMIAINFQGYYIGAQFAGAAGSTSHSIVMATLQVTAKLFEITVIASLGFLVLDIIHYFLFFDEAGLPLGLTGIKLTFSNIFYLLSPTFWSSIRAFRSRRAQLIVAFSLLSFGLITTFIGPAAALLLIPSIRTNWLAGSLLYHMPMQPLTWNTRLDISNINNGDPQSCENASEILVNDAYYDLARCIWAGTSSLASAIHPKVPPQTGNLTVHDELYDRDISWSTYNAGADMPTVWAWSSMALTSAIGSTLLSGWSEAASDTTPENGKYSIYAQRDIFGTQTMLQGMLAPVARTYCFSSQMNSSDNTYNFPATSLNGIWQDREGTYSLPATLSNDTSLPRTFWLSNITDWSLQTTNLPELATDPPSAVFISHIPDNDGALGVAITCSVYAYWTNANQSTVPFQDDRISEYVNLPATNTDISTVLFDVYGRPLDGLLLSRIDFDSQWLEMLTPSFSESPSSKYNPYWTNTSLISPGYTSLSKMLGSFTTSFQQWRMQLLLSLLVVDGIARSNAVTGDTGNFTDSIAARTDTVVSGNDVKQSNTLWSSGIFLYPSSLLVWGGEPPHLQQNTSTLVRSAFLWTATISGYVYAADSTAYVLAVVVLLSYIFFALLHIGFTTYKRWSSLIWWSAPDMVALAHRSPTSEIWKNKNIAGGADRDGANKLFVKLRVADEIIHLVVDNQCSPQSGKEYRKLEKGHKYS